MEDSRLLSSKTGDNRFLPSSSLDMLPISLAEMTVEMPKIQMLGTLVDEAYMPVQLVVNGAKLEMAGLIIETVQNDRYSGKDQPSHQAHGNPTLAKKLLWSDARKGSSWS